MKDEYFITTPKFERLRKRLLKAQKEKTLDSYMEKIKNDA